MRLYFFYTKVQKGQKWPKTQSSSGGGGGGCLKNACIQDAAVKVTLTVCIEWDSNYPSL